MEYQYTNRLIHLFYDDAIEAPFNYPSLLSSAYSCAAKLVYLIDAAKKGNDIPSFARDKRQEADA